MADRVLAATLLVLGTFALLAVVGLRTSSDAFVTTSSIGSPRVLRLVPEAERSAPVRCISSSSSPRQTLNATTPPPSSTGLSSMAFVVGCLAVAAAAQQRRARVACRYEKNYQGQHSKFDPAAIPELGPQYTGPKLGYGITRRPRMGFCKEGKHRVIPKLCGGSYDRRKNIFRNLTTDLIRYGRIKTTRGRAAALPNFVNRMILLARRGDDLAKREANEWLFDEKLMENLFLGAAARYADSSQKNFCKITPTMNRRTTNWNNWIPMAYIELI